MIDVDVEVSSVSLRTRVGEMEIPVWTAIPDNVSDDPAVLMMPGFGAKGDAVADAAHYMAAMSGRKVIGYEQKYGRYLGDPRVNVVGHVLSTLDRVIEAGNVSNKYEAVALSAGGLILASALGEMPHKFWRVFPLSSVGLTAPDAYSPLVDSALDGAPINQRILVSSHLPGARANAVRLASRFTSNALRLGTPMILKERRAYLQSVRGFGVEGQQNLRPNAWHGSGLKRRSALWGAFVVAGSLDITPELRLAQREGVGVIVVHGEDDIVFPIEQVRSNLESGGADEIITNPGGHGYTTALSTLKGYNKIASVLKRDGSDARS